MSKIDIQRIEEKEYSIKAFSGVNSNINRIDKGNSNYLERQFVDNQSERFPPSTTPSKSRLDQKRDNLNARMTVNKIAMDAYLSNNHFHSATKDDNPSVSEAAGLIS